MDTAFFSRITAYQRNPEYREVYNRQKVGHDWPIDIFDATRMKQIKSRVTNIVGKDPSQKEVTRSDHKTEGIQKKRDKSVPRSHVFSNDGYIHTTTYRQFFNGKKENDQQPISEYDFNRGSPSYSITLQHNIKDEPKASQIPKSTKHVKLSPLNFAKNANSN